MRRRVVLFTALALAGMGAFCATHVPSSPIISSLFVVVDAQTLPITKTLLWDPNPASDNVTNYTVTLDGTVVGQPTGTSQPVTFTTLGSHTLTVTATNLFGTSAPGSLTVLVQLPGTPGHPRIQ